MRQRLKFSVIGSLVVLNAALVFLISQRSTDSRVDDVAGPSAALAPTPAAKASEEPTIAPGGPPGIAVAGDGTIFRSSGGSCDGKVGPSLTISTDKGATFAEVDLPDGLRAVFAVMPKNADDVDLIGAGENCQAQRQVTTDGGATWSVAKRVNAWFVHPETSKVNSPRGAVNPGCPNVVSLGAVSTKRSRLFCGSGAMMGTRDTGRTWVRMGVLSGAKAGVFPNANLGYALAPNRGCKARFFTSEDRGKTWTPKGCVTAAPARALAADRGVLAAIAGDSVFVSTDDGRNWRKSSE